MLHTPIKFVAFNTNEQILRILVRILNAEHPGVLGYCSN